jgi:ribulose-5-phosphate 4-epimerase/fuculose-1-phosphate aldolase
MSATVTDLRPDVDAFVENARRDAEHVYRVLRATGTLSLNGRIFAAERIPGHDLYVNLADPGPWEPSDAPIEPIVVTLDGRKISGNGPVSEGFGFEKIFVERPDITTIVHVHATHLGAWSQTHRPLPIRYVPVQRWTLASELPIYIDRTQTQADFILDRLRDNPNYSAILEANGGATVWSGRGLRKTGEFIQLLEEGTQFQILAQAIGGSQPFGPGVLTQAWKMTGLTDAARAQGLLP